MSYILYMTCMHYQPIHNIHMRDVGNCFEWQTFTVAGNIFALHAVLKASPDGLIFEDVRKHRIFAEKQYWIWRDGNKLMEEIELYCYRGNLRGLKYLSSNGKLKINNRHDHNGIDADDHRYIMRYAYEGGHIFIVHHLIKCGLLNELWYAVRHGNTVNPRHSLLQSLSEERRKIRDIRLVKYLLHVNVPLGEALDSATMFACFDGKLRMTKFLQSKGGNIHVDNDMGLIGAAEGGHLHMIKWLLRNGADIHARKDGALTNACLYGHFRVIKYLLRHGADASALTQEVFDEAKRHDYNDQYPDIEQRVQHIIDKFRM